MSGGILGRDRTIDMVGLSPAFIDLLVRLEKVARYREPVLITGESGVGKEQVARALHLLSPTRGPYVSVSCPQYQDGNLTVSELFGHTRGSFTGAVADHRGAFEQADGGVLFLDEVGDLHPGAQSMLLRTLSNGEFRPLGTQVTRTVNTRVVSATNRPLNQLVMSGDFRYDLFFRLRHFHIAVPPLRERGDDWRLLVEYRLAQLRQQYGAVRQMSPATLAMLATYDWPGNARQLIAVVTSGYAMADGDVIEPEDIEALITRPGMPLDMDSGLFERVVANGGGNFWEVVYQPFLSRQLNRAQVRSVIASGLTTSRGSYRGLLTVFGLPQTDYQRFMDFLRHHDLKP
ncbi:MAG TPA: sigma 54-interacting transcriptional regulator [Vicinamibacterales bacterium]|nr:sigma 54-interacting transcriptional regulator [Vicinamibacterales bacterium]